MNANFDCLKLFKFCPAGRENHRGKIISTLDAYGSPANLFTHNDYWTSTEYTDGGAWYFRLGIGQFGAFGKEQNNYFRAIRYF